MKKWLCVILCMALAAGAVSTGGAAKAAGTPDEDNNRGDIKLASLKAVTDMADTQAVQTPGASMVPSATPGSSAAPEASATPGVETSGIETASPTLVPTPIPVAKERITVNDESVFVIREDAKARTCEITGYTGNANVTTLYIPAEIRGYKVTAVADRVFANCIFLKNLVVKGEADIQGTAVFSGVTPVEIWAGTGSKAASYAAANARVFHPIEGPLTVKAKKENSLTRATLTWSAVNGAISYHIYCKKGKGKYELCKSTAGTSLVHEKLTPGATYTYQINPVFLAGDGESIEGNGSKETAVSMTPAKPKNVKAKGIKNGIRVRWKRNKSVTGYQVYEKVHVKGFKTKFSRVKTIKKNKITSFRSRYKVRGMKYSYRVRTYKKVKGKKIYSPFVTVSAKSK